MSLHSPNSINSLTLDLGYNSISDIAPLAELTQLTRLSLMNNNISDVSPLAELTQLTQLDFGDNTISDISPLAELTQLTQLSLGDNNISDVSPLAEMTNLKELRLIDNPIKDNKPLLALLRKNPDVKIYLDSHRTPGPVFASAVSPLTEATLDGSVVTLMLTNDVYEQDISKIRDAVTVYGITGVTIDTAKVQRLSDREITIELDFDGTDFYSDTPLTFSIDAGAIKNYKGTALLDEIRVTASRGEKYLSIFWIDNSQDKIQRVNLDGSNIEDLIIQGLEWPSSIALDVASGKMYWTDSGTNKIQRANLDGSNVEDLITQGLLGPTGLALDVASGKMYWADWDTNKIQRANLDGSNIKDLIGLGFPSHPRGIALDVEAGKMYWTDYNKNKIQRANLDGSNIEDLITQGLSSPTDIALDVEAGKMYWADWDTNKIQREIQRANLDGSNIEDLITQGLSSPDGIALDVEAGKMYWADITASKIQRANLDGSNVQDIITRTQGLSSPTDIALGIISSVNSTTGEIALPVWDVNGDGTVDGKDVDALIIAVVDGVTDAKYDVNGDGKVDINDVIAVNANRDAEAAGAPTRLGMQLSAVQIERLQEQIDLLIATGDQSPAAMRTLIYLQQLLATARPEKTQLLANYPNPFNPETWIPYDLAEPGDVSITIYTLNGQVVRRLDFGHQAAGEYQSRSRAAYWDGRNDIGEPVASGLYFYTLKAGDFTATRKMLIRK